MILNRMAKTRRLKAKRQKGGKYVGEGAYGCGFKNLALPCKGRNRPADTLSKLVNKRTVYRKELGEELGEEVIHQHYREIDPEKTYFLTSIESCEFDPANFVPKNESDKCKLLKENKINTPYIVQMPEGGTDLQQIQIIPSDVILFFKSLVNLFDGLIVAHNNDTYHMDIKPPNIVSKKLPAGTFHTRFIDFGLSILPETVPGRVYTKPYLYYPPETALLNEDFSNNFDKEVVPPRNTILIIDYLEKWKNIHEPFFKIKPPNQAYNNVFQVKKERQKLDNDNNLMFDFNNDPVMETYIGVEEKNTINFFKIIRNMIETDKIDLNTIALKTDVFSLGFTLSIIFHRLTGHFCGKKLPFTDLQIQLPTKIAYISELTTADTSQECIDWHKNVCQHITLPLMKLVEKMTHIDFNSRPSLEKAKEEYMKLLPKMEELFIPENIKQFILNTNLVFQYSLTSIVNPNIVPPNPIGGKRKTRKYKKRK
jgi:serine/threonine protein kinase